MVVPPGITRPTYVTARNLLTTWASGFSVWLRLLVTAHDPWPGRVDWIGAVVAKRVELPDGCSHTDRYQRHAHAAMNSCSSESFHAELPAPGLVFDAEAT